MSATGHKESEFSRWRRTIWPVHSYELKTLIPLLILFFLITFNYNVLKTLKDTVVITASHSGAEVLPFLKVWIMLPTAILFTSVYTRFSHSFPRETVFYLVMSIFLGYFFLFAFFLYPAHESLHPHALADKVQNFLPEGCKGLVALFRNWTFTLFYAMAELWGTIILIVLFWGFVNQITPLHKAKRFYGLFGIAINLSGVAAGPVSILCCNKPYNPSLPFGHDAWSQSLTMILFCILISGIAAIALFRWMQTKGLTKPARYSVKEAPKEKARYSLRKSFSYLMRSRYLLCIALTVISYNLFNNLVEIIWKNELKELYPNPSDYQHYISLLTTYVGIFATLVSLFLSGNSIRKFGWTFTSLLTPLIMLVMSGFFFFFLFTKPYSKDIIYALFFTSPLAIVVLFGSTLNFFSRTAKFTFFDATKEMAFIPLSNESKIKGKAVIDGVASRLGKSTGSVIFQFLLIFCSTISACAPFVAFFVLAITAVWIGAVRSLGWQFEEKAKEEDSLLPAIDSSEPASQAG